MKLTKWFLNFDFGGRARRAHYWANLGSWLLVFMVIFGVVAGGARQDEAATAGVGLLGVVAVVAMLLAAIDGMAMVFRRAHDTGRSGWIWLLLLIPLLNLLPLYWLMIEDSHQGPNKYGPPVKAFYQAPAAA